MGDGPPPIRLWAFCALAVWLLPGCATVRYHEPNRDLRPCTDGFAETVDGWRLGIRRYRPAQPDPGKHPVVLCHGLGLNGSFWTLTENHLPGQLAARGYEVFVVDLRGSGASQRTGLIGRINARLRETPLLEIEESRWTVDDQSFYDVPAILEYVRATTGDSQVNWVGHSLGGMLLFPYLEFARGPQRIAAFVAMGSPLVMSTAPDRDMVKSNRRLRVLLSLVSTGRLARPLMYVRPSFLAKIDSYYYTRANVDRLTIDRFYGFTLENPGRGALKQLDPYLEFGHMVSADGRVDYVTRLGEVRVPIVYLAGEGDVLAPMPGIIQTFAMTGSVDKSLIRFGRRDGHYADYGHCDLVWSRYAPIEIFPVIGDWLDSRQPSAVLGRAQPSAQAGRPASSIPAATAAPPTR
jgi:pimeloyl-ACP methyl ester carboxylesterase